MNRLHAASAALLVVAWSGLSLVLAQDTPPPPTPPTPRPGIGSVRGQVTLATPGVQLEAVGPIVAFLEGLDGPLQFAVPEDIPRISQREARFTPAFLVVAVGQTVAWPNDDRIVHNVFSYTEGNEFDLGLYPKGDTKFVTFKTPGMVQVYCSIHSSMNATIFVAPSPHHDRVAGTGAFHLRNVPPGRYRLKLWNARLPEAAREIEVTSNEESSVEMSYGRR